MVQLKSEVLDHCLRNESGGNGLSFLSDDSGQKFGTNLLQEAVLQ